jgi:NAD(P)-dependent dehydrogenase (short-subunit alcohol dehydrogenase family)
VAERPGFVLVTGGAKRVGAAICRRLAADGWPVLIHYRNSNDEAAALQAELIAGGGQAALAAFDLADAGLPSLIAQRVHFGALAWAGLVNSASLFEYDDVAGFSAAQLDRHMHVNLAAPVMLMRALHGRTQESARAFAVNLLDQKVFNPNPDFLSYTFSKIALAGALDLLAQSFAPRVRVNAVAPGLLLPSGAQTEENFRTVHGQTLLGEGARPEDVADAVAFLAQAERITGATISVDGGQRFINSPRDVMFT